MVVNDDDVQQLVQALRLRGFEVKEKRDSRTTLDEKFFRRLDKFSGEDGK